MRRTGGLVHWLRDDQVQTGLWKPGPATAAQISVELPANETILVLQGEARLEIEGGPILELGPGDMASLPKGARTTWTVSPTFKEFWIYS